MSDPDRMFRIHSLPSLAGVASQLIAGPSAVSSGGRPSSGRTTTAAATVTGRAAATAAAAATTRGRGVDPLLPAADDGGRPVVLPVMGLLAAAEDGVRSLGQTPS
jgi:hypothetical protein